MSGQIDHVVIIVKENHTFDNYFGTVSGANGATLALAQNPPPDDPNHRHEAWMARAGDTIHEVQYGKDDIPGYFDLVARFTLCDNYFSEVAGPSTPNHLMVICADAPIINNPHNHYRPNAASRYQLPSLPAALDKAGLSWGNYGGYAFGYIDGLNTHGHNHGRDRFAADARAGKLPTVSWVYGDGKPDLSEHPKQNITDGMKWTLEQIRAIVDGGLWDSTAIFITWDDWGGWYDHVDPPVVETWDHSYAQRPEDEFTQFDGQPFRYGSRVPCLVVGPYAKPGYISSQLNSHVSLVKFCTTTFGLDSLTDRDAASNGMSDCIDLTQTPNPSP
jgi:phospholipase C